MWIGGLGRFEVKRRIYSVNSGILNCKLPCNENNGLSGEAKQKELCLNKNILKFEIVTRINTKLLP